MKFRLGIITVLFLFTSECFSTRCRTCRNEECIKTDVLYLSCNKNIPKLPFKVPFQKDSEYLQYGCLQLEYRNGQSVDVLEQCIISEDIDKFCRDIAKSVDLIRCNTNIPMKSSLRSDVGNLLKHDTDTKDNDESIKSGSLNDIAFYVKRNSSYATLVTRTSGNLSNLEKNPFKSIKNDPERETLVSLEILNTIHYDSSSVIIPDLNEDSTTANAENQYNRYASNTPNSNEVASTTLVNAENIYFEDNVIKTEPTNLRTEVDQESLVSKEDANMILTDSLDVINSDMGDDLETIKEKNQDNTYSSKTLYSSVIADFTTISAGSSYTKSNMEITKPSNPSTEIDQESLVSEQDLNLIHTDSVDIISPDLFEDSVTTKKQYEHSTYTSKFLHSGELTDSTTLYEKTTYSESTLISTKSNIPSSDADLENLSLEDDSNTIITDSPNTVSPNQEDSTTAKTVNQYNTHSSKTPHSSELTAVTTICVESTCSESNLVTTEPTILPTEADQESLVSEQDLNTNHTNSDDFIDPDLYEDLTEEQNQDNTFSSEIVHSGELAGSTTIFVEIAYSEDNFITTESTTPDIYEGSRTTNTGNHYNTITSKTSHSSELDDPTTIYIDSENDFVITESTDPSNEIDRESLVSEQDSNTTQTLSPGMINPDLYEDLATTKEDHDSTALYSESSNITNPNFYEDSVTTKEVNQYKTSNTPHSFSTSTYSESTYFKDDLETTEPTNSTDAVSLEILTSEKDSNPISTDLPDIINPDIYGDSATTTAVNQYNTYTSKTPHSSELADLTTICADSTCSESNQVTTEPTLLPTEVNTFTSEIVHSDELADSTTILPEIAYSENNVITTESTNLPTEVNQENLLTDKDSNTIGTESKNPDLYEGSTPLNTANQYSTFTSKTSLSSELADPTTIYIDSENSVITESTDPSNEIDRESLVSEQDSNSIHTHSPGTVNPDLYEDLATTKEDKYNTYSPETSNTGELVDSTTAYAEIIYSESNLISTEPTNAPTDFDQEGLVSGDSDPYKTSKTSHSSQLTFSTPTYSESTYFKDDLETIEPTNPTNEVNFETLASEKESNPISTDLPNIINSDIYGDSTTITAVNQYSTYTSKPPYSEGLPEFNTTQEMYSSVAVDTSYEDLATSEFTSSSFSVNSDSNLEYSSTTHRADSSSADAEENVETGENPSIIASSISNSENTEAYGDTATTKAINQSNTDDSISTDSGEYTDFTTAQTEPEEDTTASVFSDTADSSNPEIPDSYGDSVPTEATNSSEDLEGSGVDETTNPLVPTESSNSASIIGSSLIICTILFIPSLLNFHLQ